MGRFDPAARAELARRVPRMQRLAKLGQVDSAYLVDLGHCLVG